MIGLAQGGPTQSYYIYRASCSHTVQLSLMATVHSIAVVENGRNAWRFVALRHAKQQYSGLCFQQKSKATG